MHLGFYFAFTNRQIMLTRHRTFYMDDDDSDKKRFFREMEEHGQSIQEFCGAAIKPN